MFAENKKHMTTRHMLAVINIFIFSNRPQHVSVYSAAGAGNMGNWQTKGNYGHSWHM